MAKTNLTAPANSREKQWHVKPSFKVSPDLKDQKNEARIDVELAMHPMVRVPPLEKAQVLIGHGVGLLQ